MNVSGPPESMREHVVAASKEMRKGNWRECADYILAVKVPSYLSLNILKLTAQENLLSITIHMYQHCTCTENLLHSKSIQPRFPKKH